MKVVIIGCGNVGMSYAYALVNQPSKVDELVLLDINEEKAKGEALDLNHALPFAPTKIKIKAGNYSDCSNAHIVCISAGRNQEVGESRQDLVEKNKVVFKQILSQVVASGFSGIYLIATNPVDIMAYVTYKFTGDHTKVVGTGTTLDTARLKYLISEKININPRNVHAYVLGEHGDTEMIAWSKATIGVRDIKDYISENIMTGLLEEVRNSAYEIIKMKGNTCYGIGMCLMTITNSILNNDGSILTVSTYLPEHDIFIAQPSILQRKGVRQTIEVDFDEKEKQEYQASIDFIKSMVKKLNCKK